MTIENRSGVPRAPQTKPPTHLHTVKLFALCLLVLSALAAACSSQDDTAAGDTLRIAAIPDQEPERLARTYQLVQDYLSETLDIDVEYVPVTDYPASVSLFRTGDLDLVWYGAVTGVQARIGTPGAMVLAQRDIDAEFRSVFVANTDTGLAPFDELNGLSALAGTRFTFGSESSTSSRMMPQYFLDQAGLALSDFDGQVGFAGSHDAVLAAVESGSFETGALAEAVWYSRVEEGAVDTDRVKLLFTTPTYGNYHWLLHPQTLERFGDDFEQRVSAALLDLSLDDPEQAEILELFEAQRFIESDASVYESTEVIGRQIGVITE